MQFTWNPARIRISTLKSTWSPACARASGPHFRSALRLILSINPACTDEARPSVERSWLVLQMNDRRETLNGWFAMLSLPFRVASKDLDRESFEGSPSNQVSPRNSSEARTALHSAAAFFSWVVKTG